MRKRTVLLVALVAGVVGAFAGTAMQGNSVIAAEEFGAPDIVVGDSYAFVMTSGQVLSGPLMAAGPYPWVQVKVDGVEANTYHVNLKQVTRYKHLTN